MSRFQVLGDSPKTVESYYCGSQQSDINAAMDNYRSIRPRDFG